MASISASSYIRRLLRNITSYYSANHSTDTDTYAILQTYGREFASGSAQLETVHDNAFIATAENTALYPNFGTFLGVQKYIDQDYNAPAYYSGSSTLTISSDSFETSETELQTYIFSEVNSIVKSSGVDPGNALGLTYLAREVAFNKILDLTKFQNKIVATYQGSWWYPDDWPYTSVTGQVGLYKLFMMDSETVEPFYNTEALHGMEVFTTVYPTDPAEKLPFDRHVKYPTASPTVSFSPFLGHGEYGPETLYFLEEYYDTTVPYTVTLGTIISGPRLKVRLCSIDSADSNATKTIIDDVLSFNYPYWPTNPDLDTLYTYQGIAFTKPLVYNNKIYFFFSAASARDVDYNLLGTPEREELISIIYDPITGLIEVIHNDLADNMTYVASTVSPLGGSWGAARFTGACVYNDEIHLFGILRHETNIMWYPWRLYTRGNGVHNTSGGNIPITPPVLVGSYELDTNYSSPVALNGTLYFIVKNNTTYQSKVVSHTGGSAYVTVEDHTSDIQNNAKVLLVHRGVLYIGREYSEQWSMLDPTTTTWISPTNFTLPNLTGTNRGNRIAISDSNFIYTYLDIWKEFDIGLVQSIRRNANWASLVLMNPGHRVITIPYSYPSIPIAYRVTGNASIPSYRQELEYLYDAAMHGSTHHGLISMGQGFTGVTPDVIELYEAPCWTLASGSGTLTQVTPRTFQFTTNTGYAYDKWSGAHLTLWGATKNPTIGHLVLHNTYNKILTGPIYDRNLEYRFIGVSTPVSGSRAIDSAVPTYNYKSTLLSTTTAETIGAAL